MGHSRSWGYPFELEHYVYDCLPNCSVGRVTGLGLFSPALRGSSHCPLTAMTGGAQPGVLAFDDGAKPLLGAAEVAVQFGHVSVLTQSRPTA